MAELYAARSVQLGLSGLAAGAQIHAEVGGEGVDQPEAAATFVEEGGGPRLHLLGRGVGDFHPQAMLAQWMIRTMSVPCVPDGVAHEIADDEQGVPRQVNAYQRRGREQLAASGIHACTAMAVSVEVGAESCKSRVVTGQSGSLHPLSSEPVGAESRPAPAGPGRPVRQR